MSETPVTPDEQPQDEPQEAPEQSEPAEPDDAEGAGHDGGVPQPETGRRPDFIAEQTVEVSDDSAEADSE